MGRVIPFRSVFMGTPEFAVPSLKALLSGPDEVVAVVTQPDRPRGRGRKTSPSPVKMVAEAAEIPVLQPVKARDPQFLRKIREIAPDLLIVAAYGQILPQELLDIPAVMPINVHGSLLPAYRGAAPIQWALLDGLSETGITIMQMDAGMDTGPMLLQGSLAIDSEETFGELYARMAELGARLLMQGLERLRTGDLEITRQPETGVTYAPPLKPEVARIDWSQGARRLACLLRAMDPTPGAYTFWDGLRLRLYRPFVVENSGIEAEPGTVLKSDEDGVLIATGQDCLGVREIQLSGKRRLPVADFLRGRPLAVETRFGQEA